MTQHVLFLCLFERLEQRSYKTIRLEVFLIATIKDIARLTGVSVATVSNVLNGKSGAAGPAKTKEIFEAAARLQYQPNTLAKNLKLRRSHTVGIITEDLTVFNTPEIVDGIEAYCEEQGYEIVLANMRLFKRYDNNLTDTPEHAVLFANTLRSLQAKQVEGVVYIGYHYRRVSYQPQNDIPFVYAYCAPTEGNFPSVTFDDEGASYQVGTELVRHGHQNIGVISGPISSLNAQARLHGYQRALYDAGVLYNNDLTLYGDWNKESGYRCAEQLIAKGVSAIFAFNDVMACGVYAYCIRHNLAVGRDISLFGYDNRSVVDAFSPAISSVESPLGEMGRRSAALVLEKIRNPRAELPRTSTIPCILHLRDSVADISGRKE